MGTFPATRAAGHSFQPKPDRARFQERSPGAQIPVTVERDFWLWSYSHRKLNDNIPPPIATTETLAPLREISCCIDLITGSFHGPWLIGSSYLGHCAGMREGVLAICDNCKTPVLSLTGLFITLSQHAVPPCIGFLLPEQVQLFLQISTWLAIWSSLSVRHQPACWTTFV